MEETTTKEMRFWISMVNGRSKDVAAKLKSGSPSQLRNFTCNYATTRS